MPSQQEIDILVKARNEASAVLKQVQKDMDPGLVNSAASASSGIMGFFKGATQGAISFGASLVALQAGTAIFGAAKESMIGFNSQLEQSSVSWEVMLHGAENARNMLQDLNDFAARTPFEFPEVEKAARKLQAMGFAAKDVIPIMEDIGNTASVAGSNGAEAMDRIARALGQMNMLGRASAEDINQLVDAGVNVGRIYEEIGKITGKSTAEIIKMRDEGKLSAETFITAFRTVAQQDFGGLMEKQSKTFAGAMSTIHDVLNQVGATAFKPIFDRMSELANRIANFVQTDDFRGWASMVAGGVDAVLDALGALVDAFGTSFSAILSIVSTIGMLIYQALQWINPWARHSPSLIDQVTSGIDLIVQRFAGLAAIEPYLRGAGGAVQEFALSMAAAFTMASEKAEIANNKALALFGPDVVANYHAAQEALAQLDDTLSDMKADIDAQTTVVMVAKAAYDEASQAVKDQQREIQLAQRGLREYSDAVKAAKLELIPFKQAVDDAKLAVQQAKNDLEAAKLTLRPLEEQVRNTSLALTEAKMAVDEAKQSLTPYKQAVEDAQTTLKEQQLTLDQAKAGLNGLKNAADDSKRTFDDLNTSMGRTKERMSDLKDTPVKGTKAYTDQLNELTVKLGAAKERLLQLKASGGKGEALKGPQTEIDRLQAQFDLVRQRMENDIGEKRRQINEALEPPKPEQEFGALLDAATAVGQKYSELEPQVRGAKAALNDSQDAYQTAARALRPLEDAVRNQTEVVAGLQIAYQVADDKLRPLVERQAAAQAAYDTANLSLAKASNEILPRYQTALDDATASLAVAESKAAPYIQAVDLTTAALERQKDSLQPLYDTLQDLQDQAADRQATYDAENERLGTLKESYAALNEQAEMYRKIIADSIATAKDYEKELEAAQKAAEAAAKKGGAGAGAGKPMGGPPGAGGLPDFTEAQERFAKFEKLANDFRDEMETNLVPAMKGFRAFADGLNSSTSATADGLADIGRGFGVLGSEGGTAAEAVDHLANGIYTLTGGMLDLNPAMKEAIAGALPQLADWFDQLGTAITTLDWGKLGLLIGQGIGTALATVAGALTELPGTILKAFSDMLSGSARTAGKQPGVLLFIQGLVDGLFDVEPWKRQISDHWTAIVASISTILFGPVLAATLAPAAEKFPAMLAELLFSPAGLGTFVQQASQALSTWIKGMIDAIKAFAAGPSEETGQAIIQGIIDGIKTYFNILGTFWNDFIAENLIKLAKTVLGISSPSTVFAEIGKDIIQGIIDGISGMLTALTTSTQEVTDLIINKITEAWTWMSSGDGGPSKWPASFAAWMGGASNSVLSAVSDALGRALTAVTGPTGLGGAWSWLTGNTGPQSWPGAFADWLLNGDTSVLGRVTTAMEAARAAIVDLLGKAWTWITGEDGPKSWPEKIAEFFANIVTKVSAALTPLTGIITGIFQTALGALWRGADAVIIAVNGMIDRLNALHIHIPDPTGGAGTDIGFNVGKLNGMGALPAFAEGGHVTKPTVGLIGEKEPEWVIPDSKMGALGGGAGRGINFDFRGATFYGMDDFQTQVEEAVTTSVRNGGLGFLARK